MSEGEIGAFLSLIIFLPTIGALCLLVFPKTAVSAMRNTAFAFTIATFVLTLQLYREFDKSVAEVQLKCSFTWIESWNINYQLGVDGISLPLILLTSFISMLSLLASYGITKHVKGFLALFLLEAVEAMDVTFNQIQGS